MQRIAGRFARVELRRRVQDLVLGLLSDLLGRAKWDADLVPVDLRGYVLEHLADEQAVLVVDETGDLKKGTHTVGVQRQYTGTAGRIENAQVAVLLRGALATVSAVGLVGGALVLAGGGLDLLDREGLVYLAQASRPTNTDIVGQRRSAPPNEQMINLVCGP